MHSNVLHQIVTHEHIMKQKQTAASLYFHGLLTKASPPIFM